MALARSRGRCECRGECGDNHQWTAAQPPVRCNAPHGCNIVRKKDHLSCWYLSTLQGFDDRKHDPHPGPRTAPEGQPVTRGVETAPLAHPEYFHPRIVQVWLLAVRTADGKLIAACQRCRAKIAAAGKEVAAPP